VEVENIRATYAELEPLYRQHYAEMCERLAGQDIPMSDYNPRLEQYFKAGDAGWLLNIVLRFDTKAVGYCNVYVTNDMHNNDAIAQEDTLFVTKEHRNGVGRFLVQFCLDELRKRDVKRLTVTAVTALRVEKMWQRMGFKPVATQMIYTFEG